MTARKPFRIPRAIFVPWFAVALAGTIVCELTYNGDPAIAHPLSLAAMLALMGWLYATRWMR